MAQGRITFYPIQFIVLHPKSPITINAVLPNHVSRILGIKVVHSAGIEKMTTESYMSVVGHLSLEFNSKQYHFGNLDVPFDSSSEASDEYLDAQIDVLPNSLLTGNYENKVFTGSTYVGTDNMVTSSWFNYIVTVYLKTLSND